MSNGRTPTIDASSLVCEHHPFPDHSSKRIGRQPGKHAIRFRPGLTFFERACYGRGLTVRFVTGKRGAVLAHRKCYFPAASLLLSLLLLCSTSLAWVLPAIAADEGAGSAHEAALSPLAGPENPTPTSTAPQKARDLLTLLQERDGAPLPGYVGGRDFQNRERRLPRGRYREYDVNPRVRGRSRDAERIVIEQQTGKAYYTGDHYRTFVPLN